MRGRPAGILVACALPVVLLFGALNTVVAQQPAPTTTPLPVTAVPTVTPPTPTAALPTPTAVLPTPTAVLSTATTTPIPTQTPTPTTGELFIELVVGKDRAAILIELWRRFGWVAVTIGVLLVVIAFIWKPVGEWVQERIKAFLKWLQDWLQVLIGRQKRQEDLKQSTQVYLERLRKELARTEVIPIPNAHATIATHDYVPLDVARPGTTDREAVFVALGAERPPRGLLLVGAAGSGKSHTLRYTALLLAESWPDFPKDATEKLGLRGGSSLLPIYVRLPELLRCQQELRDQKRQASTILEAIDYYTYRYLTADNASLVPDFVSAHITAKKERCLFLFDGLDEIDDRDQRYRLQDQITRLQDDEPNHVYVVASRPLSDQILAGVGFAERYLLPLQPDQMQRILFNWYRAEYGATPTVDDEARANQEATKLLAILQNDPDLEPMTVNPLFLTAMARMAITNVGLPVARMRKYDFMTKLLLEWRRNRMRLSDTNNLFLVDHRGDHRAALNELGRFAACMLLTGRTDLSIEAYLEGECVVQLPQRPDDASAPGVSDLERLFRSIVRHTGLLHEEKADRYRFSFTFGDYFAGRFFARQRNVNVIQGFLEHYHQPVWRTPIILSAGYWAHELQSFEMLQTLVAALLDQKNPEADLFAAETLCEALAEGFIPKLNSLHRRTVQQLHTLKDQPQYTERTHCLLQRLELPNWGNV
ncbi:MAG: hypothetical protein WHS83_00180 [Chloroflexus sp.]|uniref:NACHT domain-containing protein n=1 Tax=Chloroflexus sp. TaxID=1904827 RepID=UPI00309E9D1A